MKKNMGFTLIELLVVVVILGIISLIASGMLLNALDRAKESAVKANLSAAASTLISPMLIDKFTADESITNNISNLNDPDGESSSGDEIKSPFNSSIDGFVEGSTGDKGQVSMEAISSYEITLRGFGKQGSSEDPLIVKTVSGLQEDEEES